MPTYRTFLNFPWPSMLLVASCLAVGCGGDSLNEPGPNNPQEPNNPDVPALPARTDLGTLGGESSYAYDINDNGIVVGESQTSDGTYRGFRWTLDGGLQPLPPLPGDRASRALAVANDNRPLGELTETWGAFLVKTTAYF